MQLRRDPSIRAILVGLAVIVGIAVPAGLLQVGQTAPFRCADADGDARRLVACLRPVMAHIETPIGFGSGVLLDNGYVVTNSHVVTPFDHVSLTIGDNETVNDVAVVGIAPLEDIAVLGPVGDELRGLSFGHASGTEVGDDVYLVGFPVDFSEVPEPTITSGILSQVRSLPIFGLTYLESDTAIGHGQSGGALVDGEGRLLGISGLAIESFALSLSAADADAAVERILGSEAEDPGPFETQGDDRNAAFELADQEAFKVLGIAPSDDDREVDIVVDGVTEPYVSFLPLQAGTRPDTLDLEFFAEPTDARDGHYLYDLPADTLLFIVIGNIGFGSVDVEVESNIALSVLGPASRAPDEEQVIEVGDSLTRPLDLFGFPETFRLELTEGEVIDIYVGSPSDDMDFTLRGPSGLDRPLEVTDSGEGLFGLDAHARYTVPKTGTYTLEIFPFAPVPTAYLIRISEVSDPDGGG